MVGGTKMRYIQTMRQALKEVYSQKSYYIITILSAIFLMSFNAIFRNYELLWANFSAKLLGLLVYGLIASFTHEALILLILISLLGGVVTALSIFLIRRQLAMQASVGAPSILIAILAPACPSCALGLLGLLGISGVLAFLSLKGFELSILGIILLLISISYLSVKIVSTTCEVQS